MGMNRSLNSPLWHIQLTRRLIVATYDMDKPVESTKVESTFVETLFCIKPWLFMPPLILKMTFVFKLCMSERLMAVNRTHKRQ